uniref:hypothetical protein n=1 Tax=Prevotella sp. TaxID=59823 RepID=UPI003FEEF307
MNYRLIFKQGFFALQGSLVCVVNKPCFESKQALFEKQPKTPRRAQLRILEAYRLHIFSSIIQLGAVTGQNAKKTRKKATFYFVKYENFLTFTSVKKNH